jgi:metal-sulfur cluster biosynthetic enzyme
VSTTVTEASIRQALNTVVDPCSVVAGAPGGLDDMGLVRSVEIVAAPDGAHVTVSIGVTEPMCLMGAIFLRDARRALADVSGVESAIVTMEHGLRYDESMQRPEYAARLAEARRDRRVTLGAPAS